MLELKKIKEGDIPKYKQIIDGIIEAINIGDLKKGDPLPSLNVMIKQHGLSQDTVMMAYNQLKARGIISSHVGKGYYVSKTENLQIHKIFLLFDNFTLYKEDLYNSMVERLGNKGEIEIFFHHNKPNLFRQLIENAAGRYSHYIIMPTLSLKTDIYITRMLPVKSVYILDRISAPLRNKYPFVCQNFKRDVYNGLTEMSDVISRYKRIRFVTKNNRIHIKEIGKGIKQFAMEHNIHYFQEKLDENFDMQKGDLFICISDRDLVNILMKSKEKKIEEGREFGIISYNETQLKKVVGKGITTISTDFEDMGEKVIEMILNKERGKIYNKIVFNRRKSI